ncbi:low affinity iron permease family protein [Azospirillum soli]|uniref:low affinity iron permease family protein n=1 Tax=Azospirillum soli TaxID=1304799 RepID=UPI001AE39A0B|nr:low affinity iron permease family protein [Azospirillum soli]MBP2311747.1 low affinity Fe/Cu permease [Azospirillum soli]
MFHAFFFRFARWTERQTGRPGAFVLALGVVILWAVTGPLFHFSDTWQLVINTGTTIVTFLMVFLIQNAQNRDTQAVQLKLDELIRATEAARNNLINLEERSEQDLARVKNGFEKIAAKTADCLESEIERKVEEEVEEEFEERGLTKKETSLSPER